MTSTLRVLQVRFVWMGVECLTVRAGARAVLLIDTAQQLPEKISEFIVFLA